MGKRVKICTGTLCSIPFTVYLTKGSDGYFDCAAREIGICANAENSWTKVISVLEHETHECAAALLQCRYADPSYPLTSDNYIIVLTHAQHTKICWEVAVFLVKVLPKISAFYNKECKKRCQK